MYPLSLSFFEKKDEKGWIHQKRKKYKDNTIYFFVSFPLFLRKTKDGTIATTLCNKVRVRDNSKSKGSLLIREIEKFGTFRNTYTKRWPT